MNPCCSSHCTDVTQSQRRYVTPFPCYILMKISTLSSYTPVGNWARTATSRDANVTCHLLEVVVVCHEGRCVHYSKCVLRFVLSVSNRVQNVCRTTYLLFIIRRHSLLLEGNLRKPQII